MVNTHASGSGNEAPLPAPNLVKVMARQTELLQRLADAQLNQGRHQGNNPQESTFAEFLGTQPPLFTKIEDLLDADAWLHTIESKFMLLVNNCSEVNKAKFATQQFRGPAQL